MQTKSLMELSLIREKIYEERLKNLMQEIVALKEEKQLLIEQISFTQEKYNSLKNFSNR